MAVLEPNLPNPFSATTEIRFRLDQSRTVTLKVHDPAGRMVATLLDREVRVPGLHRLRFDGRGLSSGIYLAQLEAGGKRVTRKMILLRQ